MVNWQTHLRLGDIYRVGKTIPELAGIITDRLEALDLPRVATEWARSVREEIVMNFRDLAEDSTSNVEDFDEIMVELYNWADTSLDDQWNGKKLCWIDTSGIGERTMATPLTEQYHV